MPGHLLGGGVLTNLPTIVTKKDRSQKIMLSTLLQHGCLLTKCICKFENIWGRGCHAPCLPVCISLLKVCQTLIVVCQELYLCSTKPITRGIQFGPLFKTKYSRICISQNFSPLVSTLHAKSRVWCMQRIFRPKCMQCNSDHKSILIIISFLSLVLNRTELKYCTTSISKPAMRVKAKTSKL